ncbi:MAG: hypothetical protein MJ077_11155 [Oscillospiraceae bacterium]|nr:hypothetical protein [Oscillospiraceae bacterium]
MEIYTYPGLPESYVVVKRDELNNATTLLTNLQIQNSDMAEDMVSMGYHLDRLIDLYENTVHLLRSVNGIFEKVRPQLDAHKLRTVKGELKRASENCTYILNAADDAQFALEEITDTWAFMTPD